jgi:hypothetical protein
MYLNPTRDRTNSPRRRRATAVVEAVVVIALFLLPVIFGVWEVGRLLNVQQVISNSARDGARYAATGLASASNIHRPEDPPESLEDYQVQRAILYYLANAGLRTETSLGLYAEVINETNGERCGYDGATVIGPNPSKDPCQSAQRLDKLRIVIHYPYSATAWSPLSVFVSPSFKMRGDVRWLMLRDDPIQTDTSIPDQPL